MGSASVSGAGSQGPRQPRCPHIGVTLDVGGVSREAVLLFCSEKLGPGKNSPGRAGVETIDRTAAFQVTVSLRSRKRFGLGQAL